MWKYGTAPAQEIEQMALAKEIIQATKVEPRPYQRRIVHKSIEMFMGRYRNGAGQLEPNARSILIESPTGSGKTIIGWLVAKCLQVEVPDLVVGWVAMRRNLLSQAATENAVKGIHVRDAHMISMFDRNPQKLLDAKKQGRKVLLVVDEAQHDAANSMAHLHNLIEPEYILGLSATPFRTDRVKLCFDKVIKDAGIHQLIQDNYLSRYWHYSIPNWNVETVAQTYLREPQRWGKSIFYFVNLPSCFQLAGILKKAGIVCDVVTGDTDCEAQLEAFRNGAVPVLINCMKLTEGFDSPDLHTAFVRDSGKGPTMQMAGRAFRKFPTLAFKQIVQSKQTRWPMIRTAMPDQQWIWQEDDWLSLTVNPKLNLINQNARLAIATTEVDMPQFLQKKPKGRPRRLRF
jgi:superfamily II DNA or RNA helicase